VASEDFATGFAILTAGTAGMAVTVDFTVAKRALRADA